LEELGDLPGTRTQLTVPLGSKVAVYVKTTQQSDSDLLTLSRFLKKVLHLSEYLRNTFSGERWEAKERPLSLSLGSDSISQLSSDKIWFVSAALPCWVVSILTIKYHYYY
jgi:hypothetical protein